MRTKPQEYVKRANDALNLAAKSDDAVIRDALIGVAETWLRLAEDAAREVITPPANRRTPDGQPEADA